MCTYYITALLFALLQIYPVMVRAEGHCDCFQSNSIENIADRIVALELDAYDVTRACVEIEKGDGTSTILRNSIFVKDLTAPADAPYHYAIGYGAEFVKGGGIEKNHCSRMDMRFSLDEDHAKRCLNILNKSCLKLRGKICPCYNLQDLQSAKLQRGVSHVTGSHDDIWGLFKNSSSGLLFGLNTNTGANCSRGPEDIEINKDQYGHCLDLFELVASQTLSIPPQQQETSCQKGAFKFRNKTKNWCDWAELNTERCKIPKIAAKCPVTCTGSCPCERSKFELKGVKKNWCKWAAAKSMKQRCSKRTIATNCPLTCKKECVQA